MLLIGDKSLNDIITVEFEYGPCDRSGHRVVCNNSDLYLLGGYNNRNGNDLEPILYKELWKYNFATKTWKLLETTGPFPTAVASHAAVLFGNVIITYGGTGIPFGSTSSNDVHLCHLNTLEWKLVETTGEKPQRLYGQGVLLVGTDLYTVGGTDGQTYAMDIHKLDLKTREWEEIYISKGNLSDLQPSPRYRHELAYYNDELYVLGGGRSSGVVSLTSRGDFEYIRSFHLKKGKWIKRKARATKRLGFDFPLHRLAHGVAQFGNDVWISGGRSNSTVLPDFWKLHLPTLEWSRDKMYVYQVGIYFHSMTITPEGCIYTFGGVVDRDYKWRVNDFNKFYIRVPSLKELAWNALLASDPDLISTDRAELLNRGIPQEFAERIDQKLPNAEPKLE